MSKSVQEMSKDGDEPPKAYLIKEIIPNNSPPLISIPVIDLSLLLFTKSEQEKLKEALSSWGCFQAIGHGISSSFLDKIRQVGRQFFALPTTEKQKFGRPENDIEGYGNDPVVSDKQVCDWSDRLFLCLIPQHLRKLHLWPTNPPEFRQVMDEYTEKMKETMVLILKAMALSLNIEESSFVKQYENQERLTIRFNYYSVCSTPEKVLGVKAHSDGSAITLLLQDDQVEALQILYDNQWFRVPTMPHALLVNAGDQIQIMSNGIFKSPIHRVTTSSQRDRISVAVFHLPLEEVEIEPLQALIDENRPQQYIKLKNYSDINFQCYQSGKLPLETVKM